MSELSLHGACNAQLSSRAWLSNTVRSFAAIHRVSCVLTYSQTLVVNGRCSMPITADPDPDPESLLEEEVPVRIDVFTRTTAAESCLEHTLSALEDATLDQHAMELAWLLKIGPCGPQDTLSDGHSLQCLIEEVVTHFGCNLGAVVIPECSVRATYRTKSMEAADSAQALERLCVPLLHAVRRAGEPVVINQFDRACRSSHILAVPVIGGSQTTVGLLIVFRAREAQPFSRSTALLAQHVSRRITGLVGREFVATTGLPTRMTLERQVSVRKSAAKSGREEGSILCLNIDRLHIVNETRGFEAGDRLIAGIAKLLQGPLLPAGGLSAHLSGGEFALVLPHTHRDGAISIAEGLQRAAAALAVAQGTDSEPVSVSCGIAAFHDAGDFQEGLACAQLACRTAQERGRGRAEVFQRTDTSMIGRFADGLNLRRLREALRQEGQLILFAQKIVSVNGQGGPFGYEILLRSADSQQDNVAPADLLAAAARNQMCAQLDWWVLEHAISEATRYRAELIARRAWLSINVAGPSLTDTGFVDRVHRLICSSELPPELITFEIIESAAVSIDKASGCIAKMCALGYRFALDDFGIGNNSLKTLTSLPVHLVKIDGSFVRDILINPQSEATVRAIVSLGRDLRISTVAEYAENAAIIERLRELGVDYVQGYGVERPRSFREALRCLDATSV